jgi:hypothetical protein
MTPELHPKKVGNSLYARAWLNNRWHYVGKITSKKVVKKWQDHLLQFASSNASRDLHEQDTGKKQAQNGNGTISVCLPFLMVVLAMTGVVFLLSHQLYRQTPIKPTVATDIVVSGDIVVSDDTISFVTFGVPLVIPSEAVPALVSDSVATMRRPLVVRWKQLNKAGDKLTENEVDAIARGDTVTRKNINYWGVRKDTLRLFWDEGKQKLGWW